VTELLSPARIAELLARHAIRPRKSLGQHFLADPNTVRKIVRWAGIGSGETVLEIGPGVGSLTLGLASVARRVVAVEVDRRLEPILSEVLAGVSNVEMLWEDALTVDLAAAVGAPPALMVANLPYNLAAPLVLKVLEEVPAISRLLVMVQKEVGERLAAAPGSRTYGGPSVKVAALGKARVAFPISRKVFIPEPHVDSVMVAVERSVAPCVGEVGWDCFKRVVEAGFAQRRKSLRRALESLISEEDFRAARVDPALRAEMLGVEEFCALARQVRL